MTASFLTCSERSVCASGDRWFALHHRFPLLLLLLFMLPCLSASELDFLLEDAHPGDKRLPRDSFVQCRYPGEKICYAKGVRLLGQTIQEAALRFSREGTLTYGHLLLDLALPNKPNSTAATRDALCNRLMKRLGRPVRNFAFTFPNKRKIDIVAWETTAFRLYLLSKVKLDKGNDAAFVALRWEAATTKRQSPAQWFRVSSIRAECRRSSYGQRQLLIPMRSQYPDSGGCWFTTISRQLLHLGSTLEPVYVLVAFGSGEAKAAQEIGKLLGFHYQDIPVQGKGESNKRSLDAIQRYNALAQRKGLRKIKLAKDKDGIFSWGDELDKVDRMLWKSACPESKEFRNFRSTVISSLNQGVPVGWTVARHSGRGKHRRLLIGYDTRQEIFFYSDSWGPKHDFKSIPMTAAFCETVWLQKITIGK